VPYIQLRRQLMRQTELLETDFRSSTPSRLPLFSLFYSDANGATDIKKMNSGFALTAVAGLIGASFALF